MLGYSLSAGIFSEITMAFMMNYQDNNESQQEYGNNGDLTYDNSRHGKLLPLLHHQDKVRGIYHA